MQGICPICNKTGTRHIYNKGTNKLYMDFVHRDQRGKISAKVLTHYVGLIKKQEDVISQND